MNDVSKAKNAIIVLPNSFIEPQISSIDSEEPSNDTKNAFIDPRETIHALPRSFRTTKNSFYDAKDAFYETEQALEHA